MNSIPTLSSGELHEARHLLWVYGTREPGLAYQPGSFTTSLISTLEKADMWNREKLLMAFPAFRAPIHIMTTIGKTALEDAVRETIKDER